MESSGDGSRELLLVTNNSHSGSSFTNQGQLDWVSLSKAVVKASVGVMARLSGAGIDPFTIAVGQAVASRFRLSKLGSYRLDSAVNGLRCTSGIGEALWFGFGISHIVRTLVQTEEGASCIMLCAALVETHSLQYSARVMAELTRLYSSVESPTMTPSLRQWLSVVTTCAGILSASPFSTVVEQMMTLAGDTRVASKAENCRTAGDPKDLAKVLKAIGQISRGELQCISIIGGTECGWVAALAHWFFEVSIEIRDSQDNVLYSRSGPAFKPQMTVIYDKLNNRTLEVVGTSYTIRDLTRGLLYKDGITSAILGGRVPWESALSQTFGKSAVRLLKMQDFGTAVGSASRIFLALSRAEPKAKLADVELHSWCNYGDSSYGRGFVNLIMTRFPETAAQKAHMEIAAEKTYQEALAEYQTTLTRLALVCNCSVCNKDAPAPEPNEIYMQPFCIPLLCEVIIRLTRHCAAYCLDVDLQPSRVGLENLYNYHIVPFKRYGCSSGFLGARSLLEELGFHVSINNVVFMFTGQDLNFAFRADRQYYKPSPAVSVSGICFYFDMLREVSALPETAARIHVIPGRIEGTSGRSFDYLDDSSEVSRVPVITYPASEPSSTTFASLPTNLSSKTTLEVTPIVEETTSGLTISYYVKGKSGFAAVGPLLLTSEIVRNSGTVPCARQECPSTNLEHITLGYVEGEGSLSTQAIKNAGFKIVLRQVSNIPIARGLALLVKDEEDPADPAEGSYDPTEDETSFVHKYYQRDLEPVIILQRDECLPCTIRAAVNFSSSGAVVYVVLRQDSR